MTEAEWLAGDDPEKMLHFVRELASDRKLRLFAAACCRRIWPMLVDERSQHAVELAESVANGRSRSERRAACHELKQSADGFAPDEAAADSIHRIAFLAAAGASYWCLVAWGAAADMEWPEADHIEVGTREKRLERGRQADLLRCILQWDRMIAAPLPIASLVLSIAQAAYDDRTLPSGHLDNPRLAVLSDALEEAGCDDAALLSHLRSPGPHVRGCRALDLVLGRM